MTPKERIALAIKILTGELDNADLPPDVLKIQHQRPAPIQTRTTWFPTVEEQRQRRRKARAKKDI